MATSVGAGLACAASAAGDLLSYSLAAVLLASGALVAYLPFGREAPDAVQPLEARLLKPRSDAHGAKGVEAVATPFMIAHHVRESVEGRRTPGWVTLFRDETDAATWRSLATLLRHQRLARNDESKFAVALAKLRHL